MGIINTILFNTVLMSYEFKNKKYNIANLTVFSQIDFEPSSSFFRSFLSKILKNSAIKAIIFRLQTFYEIIKNIYEFNSK